MPFRLFEMSDNKSLKILGSTELFERVLAASSSTVRVGKVRAYSSVKTSVLMIAVINVAREKKKKV